MNEVVGPDKGIGCVFEAPTLEVARDVIISGGIAGPHSGVALWITFNKHVAGVTIPAQLAESEEATVTIVLQNQFEEFEEDEHSFSVTLKFGGVRERLTVPFSAITRLHDKNDYDKIRSTMSRRIDELATARFTPLPTPRTSKFDAWWSQIEGLAESDDPSAKSKIAAVMKASLGGGFAIAAITFLITSFPLLVYSAHSAKIPLTHILLGAYISPRVLEQIHAGHINYFTAITDIPLMSATGMMLFGLFAIATVSALLPFTEENPVKMQIAIRGFFVSYYITLFLFHELHWDYGMFPTLYRMTWIVLFYGLIERLKRAYPNKFHGAEYFPPLADGLFAIISILIITQGLGDGFDKALSGPVFLVISFLYMSINQERLSRAWFIKKIKRHEHGPPEEWLAKQNALKPQGMSGAASAAVELIRLQAERSAAINRMSVTELAAEYDKTGLATFTRKAKPQWNDFKLQFILPAALFFVFSGIALPIAALTAANIILHFM